MKNNKMLTIMLIILVTITLIGVVIFVLLTQFNKPAETAAPSIDEILVASVDVPEITTNLADKRFVRISLKIQTSSEEAAVELTKRDFQTKNLIIQELSEMDQEGLKGKQGKEMFQKALKTKLNELMQEGEIQQVYITSYIIS
ncbi:MAG: flagellar basal body-associated protein FliL [Lysinibacillus sp.]